MDTLKIISLIFMPSSDVKTKQNRKNRKTNEFISFGHLIQGKQIFNQSIYIYISMNVFVVFLTLI